MTFDLTPCGHLRKNLRGEDQFCSRCNPAMSKATVSVPVAEADRFNPAFQEQINVMNAELQALIDSWGERTYSPFAAAGLLGILATNLAKDVGVPREQFFGHLTKAWPNE